jgi:hypothetical protein
MTDEERFWIDVFNLEAADVGVRLAAGVRRTSPGRP